MRLPRPGSVYDAAIAAADTTNKEQQTMTKQQRGSKSSKRPAKKQPAKPAPIDPGQWAADVEAEPVRWLWRDLIPYGKISVIAGRPDQGKGLFACHVAADVSSKGHKVLYSAVEDDPGSMTRPRLEAAGANLNNILLFNFHLPEQMQELAQRVKDNGIKLLVIDPFNSHLVGVNRQSDAIRHKAVNPLDRLAREADCAVLIVEHALKRNRANDHPLNAIGGNSSGLPAASRMAFLFGTDPEDRDRKILCNVKANVRDLADPLQFEVDTDEVEVKGRKHPAEFPFLINQGTTTFDPMRLVAAAPEDAATPGRRPDKRAAAAEWLTQDLAEYMVQHDEGKPAGLVFEDAKHAAGGGISKNTLRRAAEDMGVIKDPPGGGRNVTWALPDEVIQALGISSMQANGTTDALDAMFDLPSADEPELDDEDSKGGE